MGLGQAGQVMADQSFGKMGTYLVYNSDNC